MQMHRPSRQSLRSSALLRARAAWSPMRLFPSSRVMMWLGWDEQGDKRRNSDEDAFSKRGKREMNQWKKKQGGKVGRKEGRQEGKGRREGREGRQEGRKQVERVAYRKKNALVVDQAVCNGHCASVTQRAVVQFARGKRRALLQRCSQVLPAIWSNLHSKEKEKSMVTKHTHTQTNKTQKNV